MAIKWPSGRICTKKADFHPQIHQNSQKSGLSLPLLKTLWVTDDIGKFNVKNWSFHQKCLRWTKTGPNTYHKPMGHVMPQVLDSSSLFKCHILWHIVEFSEIICHIHDVSWVWQLKKWLVNPSLDAVGSKNFQESEYTNNLELISGSLCHSENIFM